MRRLNNKFEIQVLKYIGVLFLAFACNSSNKRVESSTQNSLIRIDNGETFKCKYDSFRNKYYMYIYDSTGRRISFYLSIKESEYFTIEDDKLYTDDTFEIDYKYAIHDPEQQDSISTMRFSFDLSEHFVSTQKRQNDNVLYMTKLDSLGIDMRKSVLK